MSNCGKLEATVLGTPLSHLTPSLSLFFTCLFHSYSFQACECSSAHFLSSLYIEIICNRSSKQSCALMLHVSAANCSVTWKVANIYQQFYLDCSHGEHVNHVCLFTMVYLQSDSAIYNLRHIIPASQIWVGRMMKEQNSKSKCTQKCYFQIFSGNGAMQRF